jgi:DNA-binding CsgD family transcriptional regulator
MPSLTNSEWGAALTSIYDSAINPESWEHTTDVLCGIVGSRSCVLMLSENDNIDPWKMTAQSANLRSVDPSLVAEFMLHHASRVEGQAFEMLGRLPKRTSISSEDMEKLDPTMSREREDCAFLVRHVGIYHRVAVKLNDNGAWFDSVAFQYGVETQKIPPHPLQRVQPVFAHLAKALDVGRTFRQLQSRYRAALAALDHVQVGMVALRYDGAPVVINAAAQSVLDQGDGLVLDASGRLCFLDEDVDRNISDAIPRLAATAGGRGTDQSVAYAARRKSGSLPLLVELTPLRDSANELGDTIHGVLVMLLDPSMSSSIRTDQLAAWSGMTEAESSVCRHLVDGLTNSAIADRRGTSEQTVKSQVAKILSKCGVANRTELVRIACQTSPPVGAAG